MCYKFCRVNIKRNGTCRTYGRSIKMQTNMQQKALSQFSPLYVQRVHCANSTNNNNNKQTSVVISKLVINTSYGTDNINKCRAEFANGTKLNCIAWQEIRDLKQSSHKAKKP